jgi:hypothetical protein
MSFANKRPLKRTNLPAIQRISTSSNGSSRRATASGSKRCRSVGSLSG